MNSTRKLWMSLSILLAASFAVLLWTGGEIHREAPPMPERVVTEDGGIVFTRDDIETGRVVWQSIGGQQRVPGDVIFSIGALALAWFVLRLWVLPQKAVEPMPGATETAGG